jgi:hypothetical protein
VEADVVELPAWTSGRKKRTTVTGFETEQLPIAYDMVAVPGELPVTTPLSGLTGATSALLELHVPLVMASESVIVCPMDTALLPLIGAGARLTVTGFTT